MSIVPADFNLSVGSTSSAAGRPNNEDSILVKAVPALVSAGGMGYVLGVADGMGGHERGEVASQLAISLLDDLFNHDTPEDVALALKQVYRRANEAIYRQGGGEGDAQRMGTTLVSAVVRGKYATIANVGDSRAYLIRARQLTQITQDHSLVAEQVAKGMLSEDQARNSPQRNVVTQALGLHETLDRRMPSLYELTLLPEDRLLLCSDGFFDVLQSDDYVSTLLAQNPQDSAVSLASLAIDRGTTDNVSAIVLEVSPSLATIQRDQIGTEIAANAPRLNPLLIPIVMIVILILAIFAGVYFYL